VEIQGHCKGKNGACRWSVPAGCCCPPHDILLEVVDIIIGFIEIENIDL
jgi:hypothetical protein